MKNIEVEAKQPLSLAQRFICTLAAKFKINNLFATRHPIQPFGPIGGRNNRNRMPKLPQKMTQRQG
jgi:hypothetical protein